MSSKGDKVCPLCTEEMDLTDQQLKPCKCGYEICVWCWNHILEMAERDNTEGRCPACRTPYDKEKIVGMAADCERLVAEVNSERKQKIQKAKPKTTDGRMHLTNVRVIQRHLVYIIGLPLNLADESLLQRREYFGQYGKVLKVSISRTATGAIQHSSNNSCCVYITYSREDEAVRCIQSVHSFVLEGRPLRACFGTTKYCHAWLKNMPCSIPDCLYLHDFGSQEDSFTKDDLDSAFTRSRVQQIVGATNNLHRRSGDVLPPPADECTNRNITSTVRLDSKASPNNIGKWDSLSSVDNGDGRPNSLPGTSWVMRVSASLPPVTGSLHPGETPNHKPESSTRESNSPPAHTTPFIKAELPHVASGHELEDFHENGGFEGLCSQLSATSVNSRVKYEHSDPAISDSLISNGDLRGPRDVEQVVSNPFSESSSSTLQREDMIAENVLGFDGQEPKGFDGQEPKGFDSLHHFATKQHLEQSTNHSWQQADNNRQDPIAAHPRIGTIRYDEPNNTASSINNKFGLDAGESSIISNILAMDFDEWEDPLTSPQSLVKLLVENDKHNGSLRMPCLRKAPDSSQSRFSFARQDDLFYQVPDSERSYGHAPSRYPLSQGLVGKKDMFTDKYNHISSSSSYVESTGFLGNRSYTPSSSSVSKTPTPPPPGFSVTSRAVPPGFTTQGALHYDFHHSANNLSQNSAPPPRSFGMSGHAEFVDPAMMKVDSNVFSAKMRNAAFDLRPTLSPQVVPFDHDIELQRLMRPSLTAQQNPGFPDHFRNRFSPPNDAYGTLPMHLGQSPPSIQPAFAKGTPQQLRSLHMSNSHWGGWNEADKASDLGMPELLTNGSLGFNKYIPSYEDVKFQVSSSSHLYNRGFAM